MQAEPEDAEAANAVLQRVRAFGDDVHAKSAAVRDAFGALDDFAAYRADADERTVELGSEAEITAASAILHRSLEQALDQCSEREIALAVERGWLFTDEAARAVKEKRLRELARLRDPGERGEKDRDRG